ncbi:MAG: DUF4252 domain-containing protein [Cyclobacteriaceae bacterium]
MQRIALIISLILIPVTLTYGQGSVDNTFKKYSGLEGITSLQISGNMFKMLADMDTSDEDLKNIAGSVTSVQIIHASGNLVKEYDLDFYNEVLHDLPVKNYQELMRVNSSGQQVLFLVDELNGSVKELILLVGGGSDNALICIKGNIEMNKLSSLAGISAPGMDQLVKLEK